MTSYRREGELSEVDPQTGKPPLVQPKEPVIALAPNRGTIQAVRNTDQLYRTVVGRMSAFLRPDSVVKWAASTFQVISSFQEVGAAVLLVDPLQDRLHVLILEEGSYALSGGEVYIPIDWSQEATVYQPGDESGWVFANSLDTLSAALGDAEEDHLTLLPFLSRTGEGETLLLQRYQLVSGDTFSTGEVHATAVKSGVITGSPDSSPPGGAVPNEAEGRRAVSIGGWSSRAAGDYSVTVGGIGCRVRNDGHCSGALGGQEVNVFGERSVALGGSSASVFGNDAASSCSVNVTTHRTHGVHHLRATGILAAHGGVSAGPFEVLTSADNEALFVPVMAAETHRVIVNPVPPADTENREVLLNIPTPPTEQTVEPAAPNNFTADGVTVTVSNIGTHGMKLTAAGGASITGLGTGRTGQDYPSEQEVMAGEWMTLLYTSSPTPQWVVVESGTLPL